MLVTEKQPLCDRLTIENVPMLEVVETIRNVPICAAARRSHRRQTSHEDGYYSHLNIPGVKDWILGLPIRANARTVFLFQDHISG